LESPGSITRAVNGLAAGVASDGVDAAVRRIYEELRCLAGARLARDARATLQPTDLVHEAFVKLFASDQTWQNRRHFFGSAARAMQQLLIDHWRGRHASPACDLEGRIDPIAVDPGATDPRALAEAIEQLQGHDPGLAEIVRLRVFAGLSVEQTAEALGLSDRTLKRRWAYARTWLFRKLGSEPAGRREVVP